jgi:hypothetical protein
MTIYIDGGPAVNGHVDPAEIELPAFLPRRPAQAATAKPRRPISAEAWSVLRAAIARQHQSLPLDSPRVRPVLPKLRLREPMGKAAP